MLTWWGADCAQKLVKHILSLKKAHIVYFHNGGNFDFHFLLEFLPVDDCEFLTMGKRIVQIKLPNGCELRDSYAIIPKKLAAFEKDEIDYKKFEKPVREKHKTEILKYLVSDIKNTLKMVVEFWQRYPGELTLASSIFKLMKEKFGYSPGRSPEAYDVKFRPYFFGGRVQFWKLGEIKGKYKVVDINSAYPWAMTRDHWYGFAGEAMSKLPKKGMEQCLITVECKANGCFPVRQKNGSIHYPTVNGRFDVTGWELKTAMDLKLVSEVKVIICYRPKEVKSMREFAETFYEQKLKAKLAGDKEEEFFRKIGLNAGYGKLALNPMRFKEVKVTTIYDKPIYFDDDGKKISESKAESIGQPLWENCWDDEDRGLSFWQRSSYREGIDKFVNVATAASITGCVRAKLMRSIHACGGAMYCDTDSLITSDVSQLVLSDRLGDWKLELTIDSNVKKNLRKKVDHDCGLWIAGKKVYAAYGEKPNHEFDWKHASKGVKFSPERIISVANGKKETKVFDAPTFSLFSPPKFVTREIVRADLRGVTRKK